MDAAGVTLQVLPGYRLKFCFSNGSEAIVDMKHRVRAMRFGRLSLPGLFETARLTDGEVIWDNGTCRECASINELLDSMQLDG